MIDRLEHQAEGKRAMNEEVGTAILAGGLSRRMGENKALLRFHEGGPTLIEVVIRRLAEAGLREPLVIANRQEEYAFGGVRCVPDDVEGAGALGGVLTALSHSGRSRVLVVGCDMPLLNVALIRHMLAIPGGYDALVPRWRHAADTRIEPLHAIYSAECAGAIRRQIEWGKLKIGDFLEQVDVIYLDEEEIRLYDPEMRSFSNANTPEEWEMLREKLAERPSDGI